MIHPTSSSEFSHFPVMLDEVIKICSPDKGGVYIDCTFGGGGYSKKLLKFSKTKVNILDKHSSLVCKIRVKLDFRFKNDKRINYPENEYRSLSRLNRIFSLVEVMIPKLLSNLEDCFYW